MFGDTKTYLQAHAPAPPDHTTPPEEPRSSLAPTQFEQLFGRETGLLLDVMDDDTGQFSPEERELARDIVVGDNDFSILTAGQKDMLDRIGLHLASYGGRPAPKVEPPKKLPMQQGIHTRAEMETFEQEYDPPPSARDWPISPDDPEGFQG